jgi:DNA-binding MarR family transcriptional regulator
VLVGKAAGDTRGTGIAAAPPSVAFLISKIGHDVTARLTAGLAPLGIEPRHFGLLRALADTEGQTQRAIGHALGIPPNRMVMLVDDLEGRHLVRRDRHPTDRRAHALSLTPGGRDLLGRAFGVAFAIEESVSGGLETSDRETLLRLLGLVAQRSSSAPPGVHSAL